jgi:hypothetical protein
MLSNLAQLFLCTVVSSVALAARSAEQLDLLMHALSGFKSEQCQPSKEPWEVPARVQAVSFFYESGKMSLVYEGVFRSGVRTILQPLNPDMTFNEDGFNVGQKGLSSISNFTAETDRYKNIWTSYRFKVQDSELFFANIEFMNGAADSKLVSARVPTKKSESVQQVWLYPSEKQKHSATVVVKSILNADFTGDSTMPVFTWYFYTPKGFRKISELRLNDVGLSVSDFTLAGANDEPIAVGIVTPPVKKNDPSPFRNSSIVLRRIFSLKPEETVISVGTQIITGVTSQVREDLKTLFLGWSREEIKTGQNIVEWVTLPWGYTDAGQVFYKKPIVTAPATSSTKKKSQATSKPAIPVKAVSTPTPIVPFVPTTRSRFMVNHMPLLMHFNSQPDSVSLAWHFSIDGDSGYLTSRAYPFNSRVAFGTYFPEPRKEILGMNESKNSFLVVEDKKKNDQKKSILQTCQFGNYWAPFK